MKLKLKPSIWIICICLSLQVLANAETALPDHGLKKVTMDIQLIPSDGGETLTVESFLSHAVFNFPVISGGIFGGPDKGQERMLVFADDNNQITLDLAADRKRYAKSAVKLNERFKSLGLVIDSKRTKLLRLGTFAYYMEDLELVKGTWASENETGDVLMLSYFDRKSSLQGDVVLGKEVYQHDVTIPKKGFYWLKSTEIKPGVFMIQRTHNHEKVNLSIRVKSTVTDSQEITALY